jgi:hypothetical protein
MLCYFVFQLDYRKRCMQPLGGRRLVPVQGSEVNGQQLRSRLGPEFDGSCGVYLEATLAGMQLLMEWDWPQYLDSRTVVNV